MKPSDFSVQIEKSYWDRISTFSAEITPSILDNIMLQAESGYLGYLYDLYFKIRTNDARVAGAVQSRVLASTKHPYQIVAGDNENAQSVEVADFVRSTLEKLPVRQIRRQMMDGVLDGIALFENVYDKENGKIVLKSINQISQSRIGFVRTSGLQDGGFGDITLTTDFAQYVPISRYPVGKIVKVVNVDKPGYYDLTGVMRGVLRWYVTKYFTAKFWSQYSETYGYPIQTIEMANADYEKYQKDAVDFMKSIQRNKYAALREGMKFDLTESNKTATVDIYSKLIHQCDDEMTIAVLGQTLTTSVGSSGSRALGDVHNEVRHDFIESDVERLDEVWNNDIVDPLVRINFPDLPYELYPRFDTMMPKSVDREAIARAIKTVTSIPGINIPIAWAHEELNIPEPSEDEPFIEGSKNLMDDLYGSE